MQAWYSWLMWHASVVAAVIGVPSNVKTIFEAEEFEALLRDPWGLLFQLLLTGSVFASILGICLYEKRYPSHRARKVSDEPKPASDEPKPATLDSLNETHSTDMLTIAPSPAMVTEPEPSGASSV